MEVVNQGAILAVDMAGIREALAVWRVVAPGEVGLAGERAQSMAGAMEVVARAVAVVEGMVAATEAATEAALVGVPAVAMVEVTVVAATVAVARAAAARAAAARAEATASVVSTAVSTAEAARSGFRSQRSRCHADSTSSPRLPLRRRNRHRRRTVHARRRTCCCSRLRGGRAVATAEGA